MSEIAVLGTRHQIVINEVIYSLPLLFEFAYISFYCSNYIWLFVKAVDLAKRFCDGAAPRIINGCLRTFVKDLEETGLTQAIEEQKVIS
jgi:hypothetical protein